MDSHISSLKEGKKINKNKIYIYMHIFTGDTYKYLH